jgi:hypothetical protein
MLGLTYDPRLLRSRGVVGMVGNRERARQWYSRARELGYPDAKKQADGTRKLGRPRKVGFARSNRSKRRVGCHINVVRAPDVQPSRHLGVGCVSGKSQVCKARVRWQRAIRGGRGGPGIAIVDQLCGYASSSRRFRGSVSIEEWHSSFLRNSQLIAALTLE